MLGVELATLFVITERAPPRAFSWFIAPTTVFTFMTLLRHYVLC